MENAMKRNNPLSFYLRVYFNGIIGLMLRLMSLVPLAALFVFEEGNPLRWLAVLTPLMWLLVIIPLRYSFAEAMVQKKGTRFFSFDKSLSLSRLFAKLFEAVLHFLNVIKYAIPLAAIALYVKKCYEEMFATELLAGVMEIGKKGAEIYYSVINFFRTLFGGEAIQYSTGGLMEGIYILLGILGLAVLILLIGVMRNSATRYFWAIAKRDGRPVRAEVRRRIRGRRFTQLIVALINLVLWAPFFLLMYFAVKDVIPTPALLMSSAMSMKAPEISFGMKNILLMVAAFFGGYLTLLPARRILTAFFASRDIRHKVKAVEEESVAMPEAVEEKTIEEPAYEEPVAEAPVFVEQPVAMPVQPIAPMPMAVPIEGMTAVQKIVNGQPQIVYVPNDMPAEAFQADELPGTNLDA